MSFFEKLIKSSIIDAWRSPKYAWSVDYSIKWRLSCIKQIWNPNDGLLTRSTPLVNQNFTLNKKRKKVRKKFSVLTYFFRSTYHFEPSAASLLRTLLDLIKFAIVFQWLFHLFWRIIWILTEGTKNIINKKFKEREGEHSNFLKSKGKGKEENKSGTK